MKRVAVSVGITLVLVGLLVLLPGQGLGLAAGFLVGSVSGALTWQTP